MSKKNKTSSDRRALAYKIVKAQARAAGVPMPNAWNGGVAFDAWLESQVKRKAEAKAQGE